MGIKVFKPTTAGAVIGMVNDYAELTKFSPEKSLLEPLKKTGGRNHQVTTSLSSWRWQQADVPGDRFPP